MSGSTPGRSLWARASRAAAATPERRNRYADFLRAVSIGAVVIGHWTVAAPHVTGDGLRLGSLLAFEPWTHWLTWAFQVMPVFFVVGGYANAASWQAARRARRPYGEWLHGRLQRLVGPVLPLLLAWGVMAAVAGAAGVDADLLRAGSQLALVPIWFLAVYVMAVVLVPATYAWWERRGFSSFGALALAAAVDDALFFAGISEAGWLNYAFVWLAVHQLGYAWRDDRLGDERWRAGWGAAGVAALVALVFAGPYSVAMVSVPGEAVSNTLPPKLPMLAIGIAQTGLLLWLEAPMRRWLERSVPWTATVLVNGLIMTIFLWHVTAATLVIGLAALAGGAGLGAEPGSAGWWALRPVWMVAYALLLSLLTLLFGRFERSGPPRRVAAWRLVAGAAVACGGLALLALEGIGGEGWLGVRLVVLLLPFAGAALMGVNPLAGSSSEAAAGRSIPPPPKSGDVS